MREEVANKINLPESRVQVKISLWYCLSKHYLFPGRSAYFVVISPEILARLLQAGVGAGYVLAIYRVDIAQF